MKNFAFIYCSFKVKNIYQILRFYSWFAWFQIGVIYKNQTFHYTVLTNGRGVLCPDWYNMLYRNTRPSCNCVLENQFFVIIKKEICFDTCWVPAYFKEGWVVMAILRLNWSLLEEDLYIKIKKSHQIQKLTCIDFSWLNMGL